ncbi:bifunctional diguanylate cyclase/phosphodiesterase [Massilia sp. TS11]|uniref:putative bifunctional diguanylate cyclase/phosphodiesterase n=1 Tax=Massilia sp. TS11 TaxID=2908003 RepID=UPI001ED9D3B0|nr:EAL domain-containing protein [Massilia sp. TS11]MCG2583266.1 EAL domain-containing protein [Massilia sp. TS11]
MADTTLDLCMALARAARSQEGAALAQTLDKLDAALAELRAAQAPDRLRAQHAHTFASSPEPVIVLDMAGYLTGWNRAAENLFGYTADEAIGQHVLFLYAEDDDSPGINELFLEEASAVMEVRRRKKDGEVIWVRMALSLINDDAEEPVGMLVHLTEVGAQLSIEDKVQLHARIIDESDQGVLITDGQERIVSINQAFTDITGYTAEDAIGQTPDLLRSGAHDAEFRARVRAAMRGEGPWRGEIVGRRKNGELFPQSVTISVVRDERGHITHTFSIFSDISVHKDAEARMQRMANYDNLTGLPNRNLFGQLMGQALTEARRSHEYGALMMIDVTRVGSVSDTLGHDVANELIIEVARKFRATMRDADILARLEGTRFAVALPHIEKREHAGIVAQKLIATLVQPVQLAAHTLQVGANIGIAVFPEDSLDATSLLRFADVAMGKAAQAGDAGFLFYREEMDQRAKEHLRLETELRHALSTRQLELHYQPKVSLRSGRIVGAEALIRWRHPEKGMISPGVFIPLAEETGLILDIGSWVLEEACRQIKEWKDAGLAMPPIAVNLSARQFDPGLPRRVSDVLDRYAVSPEQLMLEITESLLVRGADTVVSIMNELVAMGLALALDDFGTGYSSLAYLKKFPISTLKIDRSFVIGLPYEENDCAIARAIVTMAQQLRQEIVAEGVETAEQMAFLRDLGCDQLQGYLFSAAVTADEFVRMQTEGQRLAFGR